MKKNLIYSAVLCLVLFACSTEKNAWLNRSFHYTTTRFNGYFHGNEALKTAKRNIFINHKDNYEEILDMYRYGSKAVNQQENSHLDRAIKKSTKMIGKHSMKFKKRGKKVEVNKMIDDCHYVLAQASFFKTDFATAEQDFKFLINEYKNSNVRYKANLWLIKSYIYQENLVDAESEISILREDEKFPKKLNGQLDELKALSSIEAEKYDSAVFYLEKAIAQIRPLHFKRKHKIRLKYILGQLYEKVGNTDKAALLYNEVARKTTNYEMAFHAQINTAINFAGNQSSDDIIKTLNKMLSDEKNKEFKDQIYYAIAKVYEKKGEVDKAITNYKLSAQSSVNNPKQKAKAYLALADFYFEEPEYVQAEMYYDSCLKVLPVTNERYPEIKVKKSSLTELVIHLKTLHYEDSVLKLAAMSEEDRVKVIEQKIADLIEQEELEKQAEQAKLEAAKAQGFINKTQAGTWLFDDPNVLASSKAEFVAVWGNRKLEDDWRRSDKTTVATFDENAANANKDEEKVDEDKTVEYYLKDLPFSDEAKTTSNEKIKVALYSLGVIYKDKLVDIKQSNKYFEKLNRRYPGHDKELISWYQLYRNYRKLKNNKRANHYKDLILQNYPQSEYANLISNPNVQAQREKQKQQLNVYYEQILVKYQGEQYAAVIQDIDKVNADFKSNPMAPRYALLKDFAIGKLYGKDTFELELKKTFKEYPGTKVSEEISGILDEIAKARNVEDYKKKKEEEAKRAFKVTMKEPHFFVMVYATNKIKPAEFLKKVSDFNNKYYSIQKLQVKNLLWSDSEQMLVVKTISDPKLMKDYYLHITNELMAKEKALGNVHFMVSKTNYNTFYKYKEIEKYNSFFVTEYKLSK